MGRTKPIIVKKKRLNKETLMTIIQKHKEEDALVRENATIAFNKEKKRAEVFVDKLKDLIIDCFTEQNLQEFYVLAEEKILSHVKSRKDLETFKMCIFQRSSSYSNWFMPDKDVIHTAMFKAYTQVGHVWQSFKPGERGVGLGNRITVDLFNFFTNELQAHWEEDHPDIIPGFDCDYMLEDSCYMIFAFEE